MPGYNMQEFWQDPNGRVRLPIAGTSTSGLALPAIPGQSTSMQSAWTENLIATYIIAREYLEQIESARGRRFNRDNWIRTLISLHPQDEYLRQLALLNHTATHDDLTLRCQERFMTKFTPEAAGVIRNVLGGSLGGRPRRLLARQMVLRAIRLVLIPPEDDSAEESDSSLAADLANVDPETAAIFLSHLAADMYNPDDRTNEPLFVGFPESLAKELIANNIFNEHDDIGDLIARYRLLWLEYGSRLRRYATRQPIPELLTEATGLSLDQLMVLGFCFYGFMRTHGESRPAAIDNYISPDIKISNSAIDKFLGLFSSSVTELTAALRSSTEAWQLWPVQEKPLLRTDDGILVLDEISIIDRTTQGIYWLIHDHEKAKCETDRLRWTQSFGEMVEIRAEDQVSAMAPALLGGGSTFFTEESLQAAFPASKNCDAGIDFGDSVVLVEVVGGTVKRSTRELSELQSFRDDTEKIVLKKARQLHYSAMNLLRSPQPVASPLSSPAKKIFPLIVCGGQFPVNPVTTRYIENEVKSEGLLNDVRIKPLAVMDFECLEACESIHAKEGVTLAELLDSWIDSPFANASFRVYLSYKYGGKVIERPADIKTALGGWFSTLKKNFRTPD